MVTMKCSSEVLVKSVVLVDIIINFFMICVNFDFIYSKYKYLALCMFDLDCSKQNIA